MSQTISNATPGFSVQVNESRLSAVLTVEAGATVTAAQVIAHLREMKLRDFDDGAVMEALDERKNGPVSLEVARGQPPVDETSGKVEFRIPVEDGPGVVITRVNAQQVIATTGAPTPGKNGRDVFGETIAFKQAPKPFELGKGLSIVKNEIVTSAKGNLRLCKGLLSVEPLLDIYADDGKPITFEGDVVIKEGVRDGQIVKVSGCMVVGRAIEAADVQVGGSLQVRGGMIGKNTGHCTVDGDVFSRFISGMQISSRGGVFTQGEIVHSRINCAIALVAHRGTIYGGEIIANGGVTCQVLGNDRNTPTLIEAGTDRAQLAMATEVARGVETRQKRVRDIRNKIEPLMKLLKSLTPQQREKVTELMAEASELEFEATTMMEEMNLRCKSMREKARAEIVVEEVAHAGVTVRFPGVEATLATALKGPFKLMPRKQGAVTEIILVETKDGSISVLPSRPVQGPRQVEKALSRKIA